MTTKKTKSVKPAEVKVKIKAKGTPSQVKTAIKNIVK